MGRYLYSFFVLQVPHTFESSVFLVTVHDPICTESGNLEAALYGSFLPIPPESAFPIADVSEYAKEKIPGAIIAKKERIVINRGRERVKLRVTNNGDRPVQVRLLNNPLSLYLLLLPMLHRLDLTTTSSRQIRLCLSIARRPMANVWISLLELLFGSNLEMSKP